MRPIIILGTARSGTTLLAETILSRHPSIAYWAEPAYIWRYGHAYSNRKNDLLTAADARPGIKRYIRAQFRRFLESSGRERFMEKSPSNCLAMPFVLSVFPDAQVVHIVRDGRAVALSASAEWQGLGSKALDSPEVRQSGKFRGLLRGFRSAAVPTRRVNDLRSLVELPAYVPRAFEFLARRTLHPSWLPWGVRIPGLTSIRRRCSLLETCALQWSVSAEMARSGCLHLGADQYLEVTYEDLLSDPRPVVETICRFLELPAGAGPDLLCSGVVSRPSNRWRQELTDHQTRAIENLTAHTLQAFGYRPIFGASHANGAVHPREAVSTS